MPRGRRASAGPPEIPGLDELVERIGKQLGASLGVALVAGIAAGVQRAGGVEAALRGVAVEDAGGSPCRVPDCRRRAVAKGLCATHYRKARRLKMGEALDAQALASLAEDGRKARFAKD